MTTTTTTTTKRGGTGRSLLLQWVERPDPRRSYTVCSNLKVVCSIYSLSLVMIYGYMQYVLVTRNLVSCQTLRPESVRTVEAQTVDIAREPLVTIEC